MTNRKKADNSSELRLISNARRELLGIATLLIITVHSEGYNWTGYPNIIRHLCQLGSMGVDVFLLLSGIGLYYSMKKCGNIITFYKHRMLRIFPTYLAIAIIWYGYLFLQGKISFTDWLLYISALHWWIDQKGFWYVSFIIVIYLLYPLIYKILNGEHWTRNMTILFTVLIILEIFFFQTYTECFMRYEIGLLRVFIFLIGTILGKKEYENTEYVLWNIPICLMCFISIRALMLIAGDPQSVSYLIWPRISFIFGALFIAETVPLLQKVIPPNPIRRAIETIGSMSLEIYLLHLIYSELFVSLPIYQQHNSPIAYLIFVALPAIVTVMIVKYTHTAIKSGKHKS